MKYNAYIFDLDGTLCDTSIDLCNAVNFALKQNRFPQKNTDEVKSYLGNGIKRLIELSSGLSQSDEKFEKVFTDFKSYYSKHLCDYTMPYDDIVDVIDIIRSKGAKVCVASNKAHRYVLEICDRFFPNKFDCILGENEKIPKKPDNAMIDEILKHTSSEKNSTLYIGDSEVDMLTAKNSGLDLVLVGWGFRSFDDLKSLGAENLIKNPKQLLDYV